MRVRYHLIAIGLYVLGAIPTASAEDSVARQWDEEILTGIRIDTPRPPVHARNLWHMSIAMYDAWAAYDPTATGFIYTNKETAGDIEAAREEAISFAAYGLLTNRYALSVNATSTLAALAARLDTLGYDSNLTSRAGSAPSAVGNRIADAVIAFGDTDGSNQANNYTNTISYLPVNNPLIIDLTGTDMADPDRWQPLAFDFAETQNGLVAELVQTFVCPHWGKVTPFALLRMSTNAIYLDRGRQPTLADPATQDQLKQEVLRVLLFSSKEDPDQGIFFDYSPGNYGNNSLGYNDGTGYPSNPVTGLPYETNLINQADFGRVIAEFWADGPDSETPPGHWNTLANYVSDQTSTIKRIGGTGPIVNDLEWDVKLYFGLNAAVHDAAVAAWNHKGVHDSSRPISLIRHMGGKGQSTYPSGLSYDPEGLPIVSGVVEVITSDSILVGERHYPLVSNLVAESGGNLTDHVGRMAVYAWPGSPDDVTNDYSGVEWILAEDWNTYQKVTFVTPPFAGYVSGHSTFSRAAAEYLTLFTGSPYFPGGLGTHVVPQGTGLKFEYGPSEEVTLQWATYYDAADEAGISRLWGGIHIDSDDREGRIIGSQVGIACYDLAQQYFTGVPRPHPPFEVELTQEGIGDVTLSWPCVTGRTYFVDASGDGYSYTNMGGVTPNEVGVTITNPTADGLMIYRVSTDAE